MIVILELRSGAERALAATAVMTKYEGDVVPLRSSNLEREPRCGWIDQRPAGRAWDYEGWSWSPDGRSIVLLERAGEQPKVVDVQTGEVRPLPWDADSSPSWRVTAPAGLS